LIPTTSQIRDLTVKGGDMTNGKSTPTIMIVEDYDDTRLLLKQGLELLGYSVLEATNGQKLSRSPIVNTRI
jgi:response regulator RpfG family c-di-GMP phosphodiesterase